MTPKGTAATWPPPRSLDEARARYRGVTFDASPAQVRRTLSAFDAELRAHQEQPATSFMQRNGIVVAAAVALFVVAAIASIGLVLQAVG